MLRQIILRDASTSEWLTFSEPVDVLLANSPKEVLPVMSEIERRVNEENLYAAGFVCYEAAPGFDASFVTHSSCRLPLLCFGLFRNPRRTRVLPAITDYSDLSLTWTMNLSRDRYRQKLTTIKQQIELGNTYQINYTVRMEADGIRNPWAFFDAIAIDAPFAAYLECDNQVIVSASPELFFHLDGERLLSRPMKGTAARGLTSSEDIALRDGLYQSVKNRAENVMITDMLRSDIGRVAIAGSVSVPALFEVEKYRTVWQMISTVSARTDAPVTDIFKSLFPCASITGAPKVSSMKIIAELETSARDIYTGAIGYMCPGRRAQFSVAIRTALIDKRSGGAVYGVGGGIVWDSDCDDEYQECMAKTRVLDGGRYRASFELLETILWTPTGGYMLLEQHLRRMRTSAGYFDFRFDPVMIENVLSGWAEKLEGESHRIRLLLQRNGQFRISDSIVTPDPVESEVRVTLSTEPVDRKNLFLYHKTTRRDVYDEAVRLAPGGNDVLLWNSDGFITETSIANVIVEFDGEWYTPPVECGLLPGTYREWLLENGEIKERKIHLDELSMQQELMLINSVRGRYRARLA